MAGLAWRDSIAHVGREFFVSKFWVKLQFVSHDRTLCITTAKSGNSIHSCVRKRVGCHFRPKFFGSKISSPIFGGISHPTATVANWKGGRFVSLNKIGLNFSRTSTHICNYLISNMKHTLQNLCLATDLLGGLVGPSGKT
jgi:hypothetical protein